MPSLKFNLFKHKLIVKIIDYFSYSFNDFEYKSIKDHINKIPFLYHDDVDEIIAVRANINTYIMSAIKEMNMDMKFIKENLVKESMEKNRKKQHKPISKTYDLIAKRLIKGKELIDRRLSIIKKILMDIVFYTLDLDGINDDFLTSFKKYSIDIYGLDKLSSRYIYGWTNSLITDLFTRNFWRSANIYCPREFIFNTDDIIMLLSIKLYPNFGRRPCYIRVISRNLFEEFKTLDNFKDSCICNKDDSYNSPDLILQELKYMISKDFVLYGTIHGSIEYKLYEYSRGLCYQKHIKSMNLSKFVSEVISNYPLPEL